MTQPTTVTRLHKPQFDVQASRRIVEGVAVPYGVAEIVSDDGWTTYPEEWDLGVFARYQDPAMAGRVKFTFMHDESPASWVGRALTLTETQEGLVGRWKIDPSEAGDVVLWKITDGQLPGLSVQAQILRSSTTAGVVHREEALLRHVAAVDEPAFAGALVTAVRERRGPVGHARRDAAAAAVERLRGLAG